MCPFSPGNQRGACACLLAALWQPARAKSTESHLVSRALWVRQRFGCLQVTTWTRSGADYGPLSCEIAFCSAVGKKLRGLSEWSSAGRPKSRFVFPAKGQNADLIMSTPCSEQSLEFTVLHVRLCEVPLVSLVMLKSCRDNSQPERVMAGLTGVSSLSVLVEGCLGL